MTIDRWSSMSGSTSPRPQVAPGTKCLPCSAKGHYCDAHEIVDGRAVCLHCLDGVDCPRTPRRSAFRSTGPLRPTRPAPQPALAQGAEPNAAMPARRAVANGPERREKIKRLLLEGKSASVIAGMVGVSCQTVYNVRKGIEELNGKTPVGIRALHARKPDAVPNVVVTTKVVENAAANVAENITAESVELEELAVKSETTLKEDAGGVEVSVRESVRESMRELSNEWSTCDVSAIPNHRARSIYDEAIALVKELPQGKALVRKFGTKELADTHVKSITSRARKQHLRFGSRIEGDTVYLWRKA